MKEFDQLLEVLDTLLGPGGCPWDHKQTFESLRNSVVEEAYEVVDAVNRNDHAHLCEELGDLLFNCLFYGRLGEKANAFSVKEIIETIHAKLIRRHPHVFGDAKVADEAEVKAQWERIKRQEKKRPKSPYEDVPKNLPALTRVHELRKKGATFTQNPTDPELQLAKKLLNLVEEADNQGLNAEQALIRLLSLEEKSCK